MSDHWTSRVGKAEAALKRHGAEVTRDRDYLNATWWVEGDHADAKRCVSLVVSSSLVVDELEMHTTFYAMTLERLRRQHKVYGRVVAALDEIKRIANPRVCDCAPDEECRCGG